MLVETCTCIHNPLQSYTYTVYIRNHIKVWTGRGWSFNDTSYGVMFATDPNCYCRIGFLCGQPSFWTRPWFTNAAVSELTCGLHVHECAWMSYQDLSGHLFSQRISLVHCLPPWLAPYRSFLFTALGSRPVDGENLQNGSLICHPKKMPAYSAVRFLSRQCSRWRVGLNCFTYRFVFQWFRLWAWPVVYRFQAEIYDRIVRKYVFFASVEWFRCAVFV